MSIPQRHGKPWHDDEVLELLKGVQKKKTTAELAEAHQRTPGGIRARLRQLAADYYFNENQPIEKIAKFTGLDIETISDAISKRQYQMDLKEKKQQAAMNTKPVTSYFKAEEPTPEPTLEPKKEGMISLLSEIRDLLKETVILLRQSNRNTSM